MATYRDSAEGREAGVDFIKPKGSRGALGNTVGWSPRISVLVDYTARAGWAGIHNSAGCCDALDATSIATRGEFMNKDYPLRDNHDDTYECWIEDDGRDSAMKVKATHPDFAAQDFAREYDCNGDYWFVRGNTAIVCVARPGSDDVSRFDVYGESEPVYHTYEVKTEGSR